jgi:hypothetical protein
MVGENREHGGTRGIATYRNVEGCVRRVTLLNVFNFAY